MLTKGLVCAKCPPLSAAVETAPTSPCLAVTEQFDVGATTLRDVPDEGVGTPKIRLGLVVRVTGAAFYFHVVVIRSDTQNTPVTTSLDEAY